MRIGFSVTRFFIHIIRFCYWVCYDFYTRSGFTRAGSLAYNLLLSFVPFAIVVFSVVSMFPVFDTIIGQLESFVFSNFVPHTGRVIFNYLEDFQKHAASLPWISFIFLFVTSIMLLMTAEGNVNEMWKVQRPRRFGFSLLVHWAVMTIGPLLLSASILLSSFITSGVWFQLHLYKGLILLPYVCSFVAFVFLYLSVPGCKVKFVPALLGGLFASILFELAKAIFVVYAEYFPTYQLVYGALATIPLFLLWLYFCSLIFLLGAQVVHGFQSHQAYQPLYSPIAWVNKILKLIEKLYTRSFDVELT